MLDPGLSACTVRQSRDERGGIRRSRYCQMPAKSKPVHPLEGLRVVILSLEEMGKRNVASLAPD